MPKAHNFTKHPPGSMKELLTITFPLMMSILSNSLMTIVDRLFLTRWDIEIIGGIVTTAMVVGVVSFGSAGIASMTGVLAGQYNGNKQYKNAAKTMWQMIYFSLALAFFTIPLGMFGTSIFIIDEFKGAAIYFQLLLIMSFDGPLFTSLNSFCTAIGKTKVIIYAVMAGNTLNILLDPVLIWGFPGCLMEFGIIDDAVSKEIIAPMGASGAAIATIAGSFLSIIILLLFVLANKTHDRYKTRTAFQFNKSIFYRCLKLGFPNAVSQGLEMVMWVITSYIFAKYSVLHMKTYAIIMSVFYAFDCLCFGIKGAVSSIVANQLGAKRNTDISKTIINAIKFSLITCGCILILLSFYSSEVTYILTLGEVTATQNFELYESLQIALILTSIYVSIDCINWSFTGALTAGGDTKFIMSVNPICLLLFALLPTYIATETISFPASICILWAYPYQIVIFFIWYFRYKSGKWIKLQIN